MSEQGIYRTLYEHAKLCWEAEEREESRLQVRVNLMLTVLVAALGLGFFGFAPSVFPDLPSSLASTGQALTVTGLLLVGATCLLLSLAYLFGILTVVREGGDEEVSDREQPVHVEPTLTLHLDPEALEQLPEPEDDVEYHYALVFGETQKASTAFHRKNHIRRVQIEIAQTTMVVGVIFLLFGFICYALMQN